jgi:putative flavoprotein involved in K+ transport
MGTERLGVVVVGAGQAGLATSHELTARAVPHTILERGRVGQAWRDRWRSFCLVTPNWSTKLPGFAYDGPDPDGFDPRDEVVAFLERYARQSDAPVRDGVDVRSVGLRDGGGFTLGTSAGEIAADAVVLSAGAYRRPHRPSGAGSLPRALLTIDVVDYEEPASLPPGPVLIVGSGQSGCQIAEELLDSGREVFLSCGRAAWAPRRIGEHDLFWWLEESGYLSAAPDSLPDSSARLTGNLLATGHGGGHDLDLRTLAARGVRLLGHFAGAEGRHARFLQDLGPSIEWADERFRQLRSLFCELAAERGLPTPEMPDPEPIEARTPETVDLTGFGVVIFAGGFRPDYASWVDVPGAFDELGYPIHSDGASTTAPGLYFDGSHFLRTRKSAHFIGVGDDARAAAAAIAAGVPRSGG